MSHDEHHKTPDGHVLDQIYSYLNGELDDLDTQCRLA